MTISAKTNPYTIRTLKAGEPIPTGEPRRYRSSHGYVRLRWTIAPYQLVEVYEHRVVDGRVTDAEQVHHRNRDRSDNRAENLEPLSHAEHRRAHYKVSTDRIVALYAGGMSTPEVGRMIGLDASQVYRRLVEAGVALRPISEANRRPCDVSRLRVLYDQGLRPASIAASLGVGVNLVRARMKEMGLSAYPPGRPAT